MHILASNSELMKDKTFSFTNDLTIERLRPALSLTGEELADDARQSFNEFNFFPALGKV